MPTVFASRHPRWLCGLLMPLLGALVPSPSLAALSLDWDDRFSETEKTQLESWIRETCEALEREVGPCPMDVRIEFRRREPAGEPVPWAHTKRGRREGVEFYVDPRYGRKQFREDWTAPHELSHLILPYLGRDKAWFAEGFASYMQYQVMIQMGVLARSAADDRYRRNLQSAARGYPYPDLPFVDAAERLLRARQYPVMYWGGAAYFLQVEQHLRRDGTRIPEVLRDYLACCRARSADLDDLVKTLDRLADSDAFSVVLRRFRQSDGFPAADVDE